MCVPSAQLLATADRCFGPLGYYRHSVICVLTKLTYTADEEWIFISTERSHSPVGFELRCLG